jgi:hypothetical protein
MHSNIATLAVQHLSTPLHSQLAILVTTPDMTKVLAEIKMLRGDNLLHPPDLQDLGLGAREGSSCRKFEPMIDGRLAISKQA